MSPRITQMNANPESISENSRPFAGNFFFSDPRNVAALLAAIDECRGTPFRQFGRVLGREGGLDCISFVEHALGKAGVGQGREFSFSRTAADYQTARSYLRILHMLRGQDPDPQSASLAQTFDELELPEDKTNLDPARFMPGDLIVLRDGGMFHIGIVTNGRDFAHCIKPLGVQRSIIHDTSFSNYLVVHFRARQLTNLETTKP